MIEELNRAITGRIKEVLEFHLNGTPAEFDEAANAVVSEFVAMGTAASGLPGVTADLSMELNNQREVLARQLTDALTGNTPEQWYSPMSFIDSMCIKYCVYNYDEDYCEGCGRNLDEISDWMKYSEEEKALVVEESRKRLGKKNDK